MLTPQEVEFLQSFGFNNIVIIIFGVTQIIGGALLTNKNTRLYGAFIAGLCLLVSSILIFIGGNIEFAIVSLLPVILTAVIIKKTVTLHAASN
jgi:hypothetical protein